MCLYSAVDTGPIPPLADKTAGTKEAFYLFIFIGNTALQRDMWRQTQDKTQGCRDNVPMYREQLDRPGVSALALQPGIEKRGGGCMVR